MEAMKVKILCNKESFNYDEKKASKIISWLFVLETVIKFTMFPLFGYLNDKIGRKKVVQIGYSIQICILVIITQITNINFFFIFWSIYMIGIVALSSAPLTGDYVDDEFKGKGTGIQYLITTLGGVLSGTY